MTRPTPPRFLVHRAFSLLEALLALVVVALIMSVLGAALTGALRMERAARTILTPDAEEEAVLTQWREDLLAAPRPSGTLSAAFKLTRTEVDGRRADTLTFRTSGAAPLHPSVAARAPTAGLTEVSWTPVAGATPEQGLSLVRTQSTHLLGVGTTPAPTQETMLEHLAECRVEAFLGGVFTDDYDSDQLGAVLPKMVRLQFSRLRPDGSAGPARVCILPLPQVAMDPAQQESGGTQ